MIPRPSTPTPSLLVSAKPPGWMGEVMVVDWGMSTSTIRSFYNMSHLKLQEKCLKYVLRSTCKEWSIKYNSSVSSTDLQWKTYNRLVKKKVESNSFCLKLPVCHWNMIHVHLDQSSAQQNINSGHGNIECYPFVSAQACHALFALFRASPQRSTSLLALRNSSPERWQGSRNQSQQSYMSQKTVITFILGVQM